MGYPQEQITYTGYVGNKEYWEDYAKEIGGIEVCDDETGEPMFVIG